MTKQNHQHSAWSDSPTNEYYRDSNDYDIGGEEYSNSADREPHYPYDGPENTASFGQIQDQSGYSSDYYDDTYATDSYENYEACEVSDYGISANTDQFQADGIQVYYDDLADARHHAQSSHLPKILLVTACTVVFLGLVGAIISSSQPDMSAREIVQLESYQGRQTPQSVFNLADLHGCTSISDCIKASRAASRAEIANIAKQTISVQEIPAAASEIPTLNETTPAQSISFAAHNETSLTNNDEEIVRIVDTFTPQPQVQKQWSIIRTIPDMTGGIITSLAKGTPVEIVGSSGEWYEIIAINRAAPHGYMHKSTISDL